jgi:acetoin:2,6-dichlorophenolindophenol oxidoreductase subunit beta
MTQLTYREAICKALGDELRADPDVVFYGEDVAAAGGVFKVTPGLLEEFGPDRVRDTPISEQAIIGSALGAAITGLRPVVELMFADFVPVAMDQLVNQAAKYRYMSGGQFVVPLTVRAAQGGSNGFGTQHSQCAEAWLMSSPGIKVVVPATPADASVCYAARSAITTRSFSSNIRHSITCAMKFPTTLRRWNSARLWFGAKGAI